MLDERTAEEKLRQELEGMFLKPSKGRSSAKNQVQNDDTESSPTNSTRRKSSTHYNEQERQKINTFLDFQRRIEESISPANSRAQNTTRPTRITEEIPSLEEALRNIETSVAREEREKRKRKAEAQARAKIPEPKPEPKIISQPEISEPEAIPEPKVTESISQPEITEAVSQPKVSEPESLPEPKVAESLPELNLPDEDLPPDDLPELENTAEISGEIETDEELPIVDAEEIAESENEALPEPAADLVVSIDSDIPEPEPEPAYDPEATPAELNVPTMPESTKTAEDKLLADIAQAMTGNPLSLDSRITPEPYALPENLLAQDDEISELEEDAELPDPGFKTAEDKLLENIAEAMSEPPLDLINARAESEGEVIDEISEPEIESEPDAESEAASQELALPETDDDKTPDLLEADEDFDFLDGTEHEDTTEPEIDSEVVTESEVAPEPEPESEVNELEAVPVTQDEPEPELELEPEPEESFNEDLNESLMKDFGTNPESNNDAFFLDKANPDDETEPEEPDTPNTSEISELPQENDELELESEPDMPDMNKNELQDSQELTDLTDLTDSTGDSENNIVDQESQQEESLTNFDGNFDDDDNDDDFLSGDLLSAATFTSDADEGNDQTEESAVESASQIYDLNGVNNFVETPNFADFGQDEISNEHDNIDASLDENASEIPETVTKNLDDEHKEKTMAIRDKLNGRKNESAAPVRSSRGGLLTPLLLIILAVVMVLCLLQLKGIMDALSSVNFGNANATFEPILPEANASYDYAIDFVLDPDITSTMARRGREGWQVVGSRRTQDTTTGQYGYEFIFMRKIPAR